MVDDLLLPPQAQYLREGGKPHLDVYSLLPTIPMP
jgi:hypothetical protein